MQHVLLFILLLLGNLLCYQRGFAKGVKSTIEEITKAVEDEQDTNIGNPSENPGV